MFLLELLRLLIRFLAVAMIETFSLLGMALIVPGIALLPGPGSNSLTTAVAVALVLALLNGLVRPLIILLTLPINVYTLGFFTLAINAGMLLLASLFLPFFHVDNFFAALLGALILAIINTFLTSLTTIDDDYSFFEGAVQLLSRRKQAVHSRTAGRGLVLLEIDGLSYTRLQHAINSGRMPTLAALLRYGTHRLNPYDCGLPSQTSASQAGIMYGDNFDIPAFRWFVKEEGRLFVSNHFSDAAAINRRFATGQGLLRQGTSINNLLAGDARKTLLTMSTLTDAPEDVDQRSPEDLYLIFVNPYFFTRALVLAGWDMLLELFQSFRQRLRNVNPRINRLEKVFPLLRAVANVVLRELSTYTVILDVIRGSPAIYTTYIGYDEIAHHAGPDSSDALNSLRSIDGQVHRILQVIERKAPRPYDVFLLSDHGQASGATFRQRYGYTLPNLIQRLLDEETTVTTVSTTEEVYGRTAALLAEVRSLEQAHQVGRVGAAALERARRSLERRLHQAAPDQPAVMDAPVVVCLSGNLANLYFDLHTGKVEFDELRQAHPGLIEALVEHPGIGLVVGYEAAGEPWVLGKDGARRLHDGLLTGEDPLLPYRDPDKHAAQLLRLSSFPHAGDLILVSTVYGDGEVASFEELVGSHGGLGGQQTEAFLFHPADMEVPTIYNATELYALLNARRGLPGEALRQSQPEPGPNPWSPALLLDGMRNLHSLFNRLLRATLLNRPVFRDVADDPLATGQALLILFTLALISALFSAFDPTLPGDPLLRFAGDFFGTLLAWLLIVLMAVSASHTLNARTDYARTLRTITFAQAPEVITWFGFVPGFGPLFQIAGGLMILVGTWMALQEALQLSKWKALFIPLVGLVMLALVSASLVLLFSGLALTFQTFLTQTGLAP